MKINPLKLNQHAIAVAASRISFKKGSVFKLACFKRSDSVARAKNIGRERAGEKTRLTI